MNFIDDHDFSVGLVLRVLVSGEAGETSGVHRCVAPDRYPRQQTLVAGPRRHHKPWWMRQTVSHSRWRIAGQLPWKKAASAGTGSTAVVVFATPITSTTSDNNAETTPNDPHSRLARLSGDLVRNIVHDTTLILISTTATTAAITAITA